MGFFSLKAVCSVCQKECGLNRFQIKNKGWVCPKCFKEAGFNAASPVGNFSAEDIKHIINKRKEDTDKLSMFCVTKEVGVYLKVDENRKEWYIPDGLFGKTKNPRIHSYDDVLDFELLEDGGAIAKGGLGRAAVGALAFGGVGAIVGGVTGPKKTKSTCTSLKIKITLKDMRAPTEYIVLIATETKKNSLIYQTSERMAQEIMSVFQVMCEQNKTTQSDYAPQIVKEVSGADEIKKFKELLDDGIITQEEFDIKKKQLLGV